MPISAKDQQVVLSCHSMLSLDRDLYYRLCVEIETHLRTKFPDLEVEEKQRNENRIVNLRISLSDVEVGSQTISGRLKWSNDSGVDVKWILGPVVETSIMDTSLNDRAIREWARSLVTISDIR